MVSFFLIFFLQRCIDVFLKPNTTLCITIITLAMNFIRQAAGMNQDPIVGRTISFDPSERREDDDVDGDEMSDLEKLVDELSLEKSALLLSNFEHTRWQSTVKDQPLRQSARSTETDATMNLSIFSSCSSFFRKRHADPPKSPSDSSTPPRKPIRAKSRTNVLTSRPNRPTRTSSFESEQACPSLHKSLSCSRITILKA